MKIKEAVVIRFQQICKERSMKFNNLATTSGVTASTVYSMMDTSRKDLSISTIKKLCDGLEIDIWDFFDAEVFRNLELEIE